MKKLKALFASLILSLPFLGFAQENGGTYIDNLGVQDSSYMEQDFLAGAEQSSSSSGNATIYIILAVIIIAVIAFVIIKKKKKN